MGKHRIERKLPGMVTLWRTACFASVVMLLCGMGQPFCRDRALRTAVTNGDAKEAHRLLQQGANPNNTFLCAPDDACTAMQCAVVHESCEMIHLLLKYGVDPNACCPGNRSALMVAAAKGDIGTVQELIQAGADPNWQRETGETAYTIARDNHFDAVVNFLRSRTTRGRE